MLDGTMNSTAEQAAAISKLVVQTTAEFTGRGPTKAQTHLNGYSATVILRDILTKGERSLVKDGNSDVVLEMRKAFQQTMSAILISGVERITGREVAAFLSDNHIDPDIAIESFVFADRPDDEHTVPAEHNGGHGDHHVG